MRVVLQARTSSHRLPAKSLLPIGGMPLAVLCAKRLSRGGLDVVLATSEDATDDLLSDLAAGAGCTVVRGALHDVRNRFLAAARDLRDEDTIVRATADNPVPDADFAARLVRMFEASGQPYFATRSPDDGLPYGLSLEVMRLGALRAAAHAADDEANREHVTPALAEAAGAEGLVRKGAIVDTDLSAYRCTVDTLEDYLAMARVFKVADPVGCLWRDLLPSLPRGSGA